MEAVEQNSDSPLIELEAGVEQILSRPCEDIQDMTYDQVAKVHALNASVSVHIRSRFRSVSSPHVMLCLRSEQLRELQNRLRAKRQRQKANIEENGND